MSDELRTVPGDVSGEERPVWDYTNDLTVPTTLHMEPSFKEELGLVYLELENRDNKLGIWLDEERIESLKKGLDAIADHRRDRSWDEV